MVVYLLEPESGKLFFRGGCGCSRVKIGAHMVGGVWAVGAGVPHLAPARGVQGEGEGACGVCG